MAVEENENSAIEGSIDPNYPVFAELNLTFAEALWGDTQHTVSGSYIFFLESIEKATLVLLFQHWAQMLPDLLHMQTLHFEVIGLDEQIVTLEAKLKAEDKIIKALS